MGVRVLYIDVDSLRPDHLGCYGYERRTSPHIDALAAGGTRCTGCYATDAPCLPSRTALWSGRLGIHTGVVGHGGTAADPVVQGARRGFTSAIGEGAWMAALRRAGLRTATVSTFGERHSAFHWYAGFHEIYNHGTRGAEQAHEVLPYALHWLERWARHEDWFLHVNLWDPHTPYRVPPEQGEPFAADPPPAWLNQAVLDGHRAGFGPHGAREPQGLGLGRPGADWPRMPQEIATLQDWKRWIDGIRYADRHIGVLLDALERHGIADQTLIVLSADHGENQGELNIYGDHQTADECTCHVPLVVSGPGIARGHVDPGLHCQLDLAPTVCELAGARPGRGWDGRSFAAALRGGDAGRDHVVLSQGAWACQRGVRWEHWLLLRTYDPGLKDLAPLLLFDLEADPHETRDLCSARPAEVRQGQALLEGWLAEQAIGSPLEADPLQTVLREGGPFHTRGQLEPYCARLRATGRAQHAERLLATGGRGW
jgi:arylsulfatase A-like enzyme